MNARLPFYTGPTCNPTADAERWESEQEAADERQEAADREAPGIVFRQLQAIHKPAGWFDARKFLGRYSAEEILRDAMDDSDDDVSDRYAEFMIDTTPAAKEKMLKAMAVWFCKTWAHEVYTDYLESLQ